MTPPPDRTLISPEGPLVAIVADDLTGALDSTAPFASAGLTTCVAVDPSWLPAAIASRAEVIAVSTGSRDLEAERAAAAVLDAARGFESGSVTIAFKKIDSRLKGPVAAEVQAALNGFRRVSAIVCPAIPDLGRTVSGGQVRGRGAEAGLSIAGSLGPIAARCRIPDVGSDGDADAVADDILDAPGTILAVGARGLAGALARKLSIRADRGGCPAVPLHLPRPVLVGIGSRDPITRAQVEVLRERLGPILVEATDAHRSSSPATDVMGYVMSGKPSALAPAEAAERFADQLAGAIRDRGPRSLVLSGGDTAGAVMTALGIGLLRVSGEILPGLPFCRALGDGPGMVIVTKSGGFGEPDTLLRLLDAGN